MNESGHVVSRSKMCITVINSNAHVEQINWYEKYDKLRNASGLYFPGYFSHGMFINN
uniref:DDE_Tnp_1_7 domain-containing protein n=1 Tax=Meloidogyne hapla TaxID=6305 RepID=A0A1I8BFS6_MELHA